MIGTKRTVDVVIDEDGNVKLDVIGCEDSSCEDLTRAFSEALGNTVDNQRKPEFYNRPVQAKTTVRR